MRNSGHDRYVPLPPPSLPPPPPTSHSSWNRIVILPRFTLGSRPCRVTVLVSPQLLVNTSAYRWRPPSVHSRPRACPLSASIFSDVSIRPQGRKIRISIFYHSLSSESSMAADALNLLFPSVNARETHETFELALGRAVPRTRRKRLLDSASVIVPARRRDERKLLQQFPDKE